MASAGGEQVHAFLPVPLPPTPALEIDPGLRDQLDNALLSLGRLDSISALLPDTRLLYMYVRKEAVLSSQIEGSQSSLSDLLLFEADETPGVPLDDVTEVSSYVAAMGHGLARLLAGFPLSNRLIREIHEILLREGRRSASKHPGEFRRSQNWIGGTRPGNAVFVPPPPDEVPGAMGALERWLHDDPERTPALLKAALAHVQFETIHPFLDGNGRVGRLLVTLLLVSERILEHPLLYLSLYFKQHRAEYYSLLTRVREEGDWESWLGFFADGVRETATGAVTTAQRLTTLAGEHRAVIQQEGRRVASSMLRLHQALLEQPIASATLLGRCASLSAPAVNKALAALQSLDIVTEITGRRRNRVFSYADYVRILSEGTEPL